MAHHRRRSRLRRVLTAVTGVSVGALLLFAGGRSELFSRGSLSLDLGVEAWSLQQQWFVPPTFIALPPELLSEAPADQEPAADLPIQFPRRLLPVRRGADQSPTQQEDDAVLLPDQEVLVLAAEPVSGKTTCVFQGGASSPARALGRLPGPGRHAYLCPLLDSGQPLQAPLLLSSSSAAAPSKLLNWNQRLVFDAAVLDSGDLLVFAKDVNRRKGINTPAADVQCIYSGGANGMEASLPAITSSQQVIRCPSPPTPQNSGIRVTLAVKGEEPLPSLATYRPIQPGLSVARGRKLICACTMVRDVAKFLPEWVHYHAAVGIEQFILYDNASEDDLVDQVARLKADGIDISTVPWPWTKTQEAGLSHCAASNQASCKWMAFIDIDEFIFSPSWSRLEKPSKSMLEAVVSVDPQIGQIHLGCFDFGPSGHTTNPLEGVCQGYTCRVKKVERHKSLVLLDAVADSLENSVHHFTLKSGFKSVWNFFLRINHYKYQAWPEFTKKFKRRVSTFVADWTDPVNLQSNDRTPGLGVDAVEPAGWAQRFCELKDSTMQEVSAKWFGFAFGGPEFKSKGSHGTRIGEIAPSPSLP